MGLEKKGSNTAPKHVLGEVRKKKALTPPKTRFGGGLEKMALTPPQTRFGGGLGLTPPTKIWMFTQGCFDFIIFVWFSPLARLCADEMRVSSEGDAEWATPDTWRMQATTSKNLVYAIALL